VTRVVIDTNVFVSSFFGGNPRKIISLWERGEIQLCLSQPIVDEYVAVLQRMRLRDQHALQELLDLFARGHSLLFTAKTPTLNIVQDDTDDDKFIECAVALKSSFIISGDQHLKGLGRYMNIMICSPREFLEHLQ